MIPEYRLKTKTPYVIAVEGEGLGSCKSLTLVVFAELAHRCGYTIYTNMESLNIPHRDFYKEILPYLSEYNSKEIKMPEHAFYVLDDVNKVAESRRPGGQKEIALSQFMQDVRKAHSMFVYSVPIFIWTEARFYDVTDLAIDTAFDQESETVFWTLWDPMTTKITGRRVVIGRMAADARPIYGLYDSWEKIASPRPEQIFGGEKAGVISDLICKACGSTQVRTNVDGRRRCTKCGYTWKAKKVKIKRAI